ncbi:hypothetical protein [Leptothoe spongobia]|nr:hypothetical protein [Leptothoe spongobia]
MGRINRRLGWLAGLLVLVLPTDSTIAAPSFSGSDDFSPQVPRQLTAVPIAQAQSETEGSTAEANVLAIAAIFSGSEEVWDSVGSGRAGSDSGIYGIDDPTGASRNSGRK